MILSTIFPYLILSALVVFLLPGTKLKSLWSVLAITAGGVYAAIAGVEAILAGASPLIEGLDGLGGVFLLAIAIGGTACSIYGAGYTRAYAREKGPMQMSVHYASLVVLFYSMIGVVTAAGDYAFLFWWELMTLSSFLLVMFDSGKKEVLHAAVGYLVLMHIGFFFLLGAFASDGGSFFAAEGMTIPVFLLFMVGFGLKAGLFPLHMWLPVAHPAAPSHVSALMSGVMIKMGIYGIIRAALALTPESLYAMGILIFALGAITAVFGIVKAAVQTDLKRLLAYSSIENIGIISLGIGFGLIGKSMGSHFITYIGFGGALLHMLGHSHYKMLLFMGAGSVVNAIHSRDMNRMGGLLKQMPITGILFLVGTMAICAVPATMGFTSEFVLMNGLFKSIAANEMIIASIVGIAVLALVGGLALMTFSKAFGIAFLGNPRSRAAMEAKESNAAMLIGQVLPLVGVLLGPVVYTALILNNTDILFGAGYYAEPLIETVWDVEIVAGIVVLLVIGLVALKKFLNWKYGIKPVKRPTWGCAFTVPNKRMQYSASSYNRDLQTVFSDRGADSQVKEFSEEEIFPEKHDFKRDKEDDTAAKAVTRYFLRSLRYSTARLALFQTGKTNHYILHALLLLMVILILSLCGVL